MGFGGLAGDQCRPEVIRRIHQRSNASGFTETNVTRWVTELILHHPAPPRVSEVCCSFPDLFSVDSCKE